METVSTAQQISLMPTPIQPTVSYYNGYTGPSNAQWQWNQVGYYDGNWHGNINGNSQHILNVEEYNRKVKELSDDIIRKYKETNINKGDDEPTMTLYNVIVVTKKKEIICDTKVVAENADEAKFLAEVDVKLREKHLSYKNVTVLTVSLGDVKVEKDPETVRVIEARVTDR